MAMTTSRTANRAGWGALVAAFSIGCSAEVTPEAADGDQGLSIFGSPHGYDVQKLAGLPRGSAAQGINDRGQVIANTVDETTRRAFIWEAGNAVDLGSLGGDYTYAWDINENGAVVGESETQMGLRFPFLWKDGVMKGLVEPNQEDPRQGVAYGVNAADQVVGVLYAGGTSEHARGFLWDDGVFEDLLPPSTGSENKSSVGASTWSSTSAWDINDAGDIVGDARNEQSILAASWRDGASTVLAGSPNGESDAALAVNTRGQAVGRNTDAELGRRAAVWADGEVAYLPFESAVAAGVNDAGMIVGRHAMTSGGRRAFAYLDGVAVDVHDATHENSYESTEATSSDLRGRIVGSGFVGDAEWANAEAVMWTPSRASTGVR